MKAVVEVAGALLKAVVEAAAAAAAAAAASRSLIFLSARYMWLERALAHWIVISVGLV